MVGWVERSRSVSAADIVKPNKGLILLQIARKLESEPSILGVSSHLLAVANKVIPI